MLILAAILFIVVHTPGGAVVEINIAQISSLHEPREDPLTTKDAACLIYMTNGRFISTTEPCKEIEAAILSAKSKTGWPK